jgi:glucose-1-phosphate adenylyltransferase
MVLSEARYDDRLSLDSLALILAGGKGTRLQGLTRFKAKPALYFGGNFRVIDFPLSNCVNSGLKRIGVMTQYKPHSLIRHLARGWGHLNRDLDEFVELLPAFQQGTTGWYEGTANAIYQNIEFIREHNPKYVAVLAADHIYKMDYANMLAHHAHSGADMTVSCIELPIEEAAGAFGVMCVDENNHIIDFQEKPAKPCVLKDREGYTLASMGNYVFNTEFLIDQLFADASNPKSQHDFGKDIIPAAINKYQVDAFRFRDSENHLQPYWRDIGTLDAFWQANIDLIAVTPKLDIYDDRWPIWTYLKQRPPAKFVYNDDKRRGQAVDSIVASGCIISGAKISNSLLSTDVHVHSYSTIDESVILPNVEIGRNVKITRAIIDEGCKIPDGMTIGCNKNEDTERGFQISELGIVLVTKDMLKEKEELRVFPSGREKLKSV